MELERLRDQLPPVTTGAGRDGVRTFGVSVKSLTDQHSEEHSPRTYLVNNVCNTILENGIRRHNLRIVDIVDAVLDRHCEGVARQRRVCSSIRQGR